MAPVVRSTVARGLPSAAILSPKGDVIASDGVLEADELRAIAAFVCQPRTADFLDRLFSGELVTATVAEREICLGVAGRCVFILTVLGSAREESLEATALFRQEVDELVGLARADSGRWIPPIPGPTGSGSPPAEAFVFLPTRDRRGDKN